MYRPSRDVSLSSLSARSLRVVTEGQGPSTCSMGIVTPMGQGSAFYPLRTLKGPPSPYLAHTVTTQEGRFSFFLCPVFHRTHSTSAPAPEL
jgi:hypothetical protein